MIKIKFLMGFHIPYLLLRISSVLKLRCHVAKQTTSSIAQLNILFLSFFMEKTQFPIFDLKFKKKYKTTHNFTS